MSIRPLLFVAVCGAACHLLACKVYDPLYCDQESPCRDSTRSFCDVEGEYPASEGVPRTCIPDPNGDGDDDGDGAAIDCTAGEFQRCDGSDSAIYCGSDGASEIEVACEAGCGDSGCLCSPDTSTCSKDVLTICGTDGVASESRDCPLGCYADGTRCNEIDPSNGLRSFLEQAAAAPELVIPDGSTIDTDTGTVLDSGGGTIEASSGIVSGSPAIRVFSVGELEMGDVEISGALAIAFVSHGNITITGHVRVRAGSSAGPCEGQGTEGGGGSGGGGFGSTGGKGGAYGSSAGGAGGVMVGNQELVPLLGGCPSQLPVECAEYLSQSPTPGGGALQLVSRTRIVLGAGEGKEIGGVLDAGGLGGGSCDGWVEGANSGYDPNNLGRGGGSGGGILIEAPVIELETGAALVANGGGGGCGVAGGGFPGLGEDGGISDQPAPGGVCSTDGRTGGPGGSSQVGAGPGDFSADNTVAKSTGGGGGVGRIRINAARAVEQADDSVVSPAASLGSPGSR